jgi:hypothetical protein
MGITRPPAAAAELPIIRESGKLIKRALDPNLQNRICTGKEQKTC